METNLQSSTQPENPSGKLSFLSKPKTKIFVIVFLIFFNLCCAAAILIILYLPNIFSPRTVNVTPQISLTPTSIPTPTPIPISKLKATTRTFISEKFNIILNYSITNMNVKEIGNVIYSYYDNKTEKLDEDQHIEVFYKNKDESLEDAIRKQILFNYSERDCQIINTTSKTKAIYPTTYERVEINHPVALQDTLAWVQSGSKCPVKYTVTGHNGSLYFLSDSKNPDIFLFFDIGQMIWNVEKDLPWTRTVRFIDNSSSTPVTNWKTYINQKYGFEIKYPPETKIDDSNETYIKIGDNVINYNNQYNSETEFFENLQTKRDTCKDLLNQIKTPFTNQKGTIYYQVCDGYWIRTPSSESAYLEFIPKTDGEQILLTLRLLSEDENAKINTNNSLVQIPLTSTDGWKTVSKENISFKVPPDAKCVFKHNPQVIDDKNCTYIYTADQQYVPSVSIAIKDYQGTSRRQEFFGDNYEDCHWLYEDAMFGSVKALQIAADGGWCQGGGGGIVTVVGNKLVIFENLNYGGDQKIIPRYDIRDTIISTLKEIK